MKLNIDKLVKKAIKWRKERARLVGGVVILFEGDVQGWCNELRNPEHWQPGCVAVDVNLACWQAVGGNEYDGAERWQPISVV